MRAAVGKTEGGEETALMAVGAVRVVALPSGMTGGMVELVEMETLGVLEVLEDQGEREGGSSWINGSARHERPANSS